MWGNASDLGGSPLAKRAYLDHRMRISTVGRRPQSAVVRPTASKFSDVYQAPTVLLPMTSLLSHHDFMCTVVVALWEELGVVGYERFEGWSSSSPSVVLACATMASVSELHRACLGLAASLPSTSPSLSFEVKYFKENCRQPLPDSRKALLSNIVVWFEGEISGKKDIVTTSGGELGDYLPRRPQSAGVQRDAERSQPVAKLVEVARPLEESLRIEDIESESDEVTPTSKAPTVAQRGWRDPSVEEEQRSLFRDEDESRDVIVALEATMRVRLPQRQQILSPMRIIRSSIETPKRTLVKDTPRDFDSRKLLVFQEENCLRGEILAEARQRVSLLMDLLGICIRETALRSEIADEVEPHYRNELTFRIHYLLVGLSTKPRTMSIRDEEAHFRLLQAAHQSRHVDSIHEMHEGRPTHKQQSGTQDLFRQDDAATKIQSIVRMRQARRLLSRKRMRRSHMDYARRLNEAAVRIQCMFRCTEARKELKKRRAILSACAASVDESICSNSSNGNLSHQELSRMIDEARFSAVQEFINSSDKIRSEELLCRRELMADVEAYFRFVLRFLPVRLTHQLVVSQDAQFREIVDAEQVAARELLAWRHSHLLCFNSPTQVRKRTIPVDDSRLDSVVSSPPRSTSRRLDEMRQALNFGDRETLFVEELDRRMSLMFDEGMELRRLMSHIMY